MGFWHDATGYAILGVTSLGLAGVAALLSPPGSPPATPAVESAAARRAPRAGVIVFAGGASALVALGLTFAVLSWRTLNPGDAPADVAVQTLLPDHPAGWQVAPVKDLYRFSGVLQTEQLAERTYFRANGQQPTQVNIYVAHWPAGAAPVSLVASHTPDACWPGAGWAQVPTPDRQVALPLGGQTLPVAEHRVFAYGGSPQHVWFWHVYNGRVISYRDPYSIPALVQIALAYGFRREGAQTFVRLSSNRPWEELQHEPLLQEIFAQLAPLGLRP
jgi:hypothetical protein